MKTTTSSFEPSAVANPADQTCLIIALKSRLTLARSPVWPLRMVALNGKVYHDAQLGEWTGFYDWLRGPNGGLLGVRYWLNEGAELETPAQHAEVLGYTIVNASRFIEIYLSDRRNVEAKLSADQEFLYDPLFRSDDGEYALGFAMEGLSESDVRDIENAHADWTTFQALE